MVYTVSKKYLTTLISGTNLAASAPLTRTKIARSTTSAAHPTHVGHPKQEGQERDAVSPQRPDVAASGQVAGETSQPQRAGARLCNEAAEPT